MCRYRLEMQPCSGAYRPPTPIPTPNPPSPFQTPPSPPQTPHSHPDPHSNPASPQPRPQRIVNPHFDPRLLSVVTGMQVDQLDHAMLAELHFVKLIRVTYLPLHMRMHIYANIYIYIYAYGIYICVYMHTASCKTLKVNTSQSAVANLASLREECQCLK